MRLWVERLRWGLLAGGLLLTALLIVLMGYGRYRAVKAWRQIVARSGATVTHEAHEVTYSQAVGGRTVFTIHAADAMPHGDGRYTLHNVELLLYGTKGSRADRVYGSEFDYDEKSGIARALGEVHMDLQAPQGLAPGGTRGDKTATKQDSGGAEPVAETPQTIHVRTSGLIYQRKLGVASTDQQVEIAYQGFQGSAKGAEFDSAQSVVHLLAAVRVNGDLRGKAATLTASKADLERDTDVIRLAAPRVRSGSREASASAATLHLRKDGSLELVEARGEVAMRSGTQMVRAAALNAEMSEGSLLQHAELSGGVSVEDSRADGPMQGTARTVNVVCDSLGVPARVVAQGAVALAAQDRAPDGRPLHRQMSAAKMVIAMQRGTGGRPQQVSAIEGTGSAWVRNESIVASNSGVGRREQIKTTELAGDDLRLSLNEGRSGKDVPRTLTATGHTRLQQKAPDGASQTSTGDALTARFAEPASSGPGGEGVRLESAEQTGHVQLRSEPAASPGAKQDSLPTEASAERAQYQGALDQVTLAGNPEVHRGDTDVSATTIVVSMGSGDAAAHGNVSATFLGSGAEAGSAATHAAAHDALLRRSEETVVFDGTDAQPARMWQGASQLEAATLLLDRKGETLRARPADAEGRVRAVFASAPKGGQVVPGGTTAAKGRSPGSDRVVRVSSAKLDYSGVSREAVFTGGVRADGATGDVRGQRAVVFLNPAPAGGSKPRQTDRQGGTDRFVGGLGGSLDKIVVAGGVRLEQPGRIGTGEQLLYTAGTGEFVLTGAEGRLPHITDQQQGSITGATLLFASRDSTIIVAGEPAPHDRARGRVHTETAVRR